VLVDTTFLVDVMRNDVGAVEKAKELADGNVPVLVGAPSIFELYVGVGLSVKSSDEREKVLEVLRSLAQLQLDPQSAARAGLIYAQRAREGTKMDPEDAMLAGIAVENHQPLLTRNRKRFSGIHDLKVEGY
jgi:predicted nucleic acid-binding protein